MFASCAWCGISRTTDTCIARATGLYGCTVVPDLVKDVCRSVVGGSPRGLMFLYQVLSTRGSIGRFREKDGQQTVPCSYTYSINHCVHDLAGARYSSSCCSHTSSETKEVRCLPRAPRSLGRSEKTKKPYQVQDVRYGKGSLSWGVKQKIWRKTEFMTSDELCKGPS